MTNDKELLHVMPVGDLKEHTANIQCWCIPNIEDGVAVHNSLDRRELYENTKH